MEQQRRIVSYLRVSTERSQGANGLGIDAPRATVADFCLRGGFTLAKEFVEVESGRNNERIVLTKALAHARRIVATLLVAKLDRLSRSVRFIATVLDAGVEFRACDVPDGLAAVAPHPLRRCGSRSGGYLAKDESCAQSGTRTWHAAGRGEPGLP